MLGEENFRGIMTIHARHIDFPAINAICYTTTMSSTMPKAKKDHRWVITRFEKVLQRSCKIVGSSGSCGSSYRGALVDQMGGGPI
jgi:hypothetical protein